jgi:cell wall-associated NlpC family hydrolase
MSPMPRDFDRAAFLREAEALVGTPFRLHGRHAASGLDCIGLIALALGRSGGPELSPTGYRLRNTDISGWLSSAAAAGLAAVEGTIEPADILLLRPGPAQHHLAIALEGDAILHAHAGLRRAVRQPRPHDWPLLTHWRFAADR